MASSIFVAPFVQGQGAQLTFDQIAPDGIQRDGDGWSVIGHVPQAGTCLVRVWASEAALDALAEDPDYLFVEEAL
jgi:hypothetical protein